MIQGKGNNSIVNLFVGLWAMESFRKMVRKEKNRQSLLKQAGNDPMSQTRKFLTLIFITIVVFAFLVMVVAIRSY